jgi:hypothetical protein
MTTSKIFATTLALMLVAVSGAVIKDQGADIAVGVANSAARIAAPVAWW